MHGAWSFRLKILIIADGPVPHPYMNYRADPLAKYLSYKGYNVSVLCPKPTPAKVMNARGFDDVDFIYVPRYKSIHRPVDLTQRSYQIVSLVKKLRTLITKRKYDVIRPISFIPAWTSIMASYGLNPSAPIVTNLSDFYSDLYKQFNLPFSSSVTKFLRKMESSIVRKSDVFIVDTPTQRKYWKHWGLDEKRCVVLPHGLPRSFSCDSQKSEAKLNVRMKYGIGTDTKIIFYIGDVSQLDGLDILIAATPAIIKENENVKFMIIGSGTEEYMKKLKKQIRESAMERYFIFVHRIPHFQVPEFIATADVCVAPFRFTLTSNSSVPNKILEYIAIKKPVVATAGDGLKETLGDVIKYVEPENPQMLACAILDILKDGSFVRRSRDKMETVIDKLNWRNIIQREELIIRAALNHNVQDFRIFDYRLHD